MVIDASVAVKWIVPEEGSGKALEYLDGDHVSPTLLLSEIGNALWKKVRRGELKADDSLDPQLRSLAGYVRLVDDRSYVARALQLARALDHPIYDCVYLALAEERETSLLTADAKFLRKVTSHGWADRVQGL